MPKNHPLTNSQREGFNQPTIINLSSIVLDHTSNSILHKGPNFTITTNKIHVDDIISNIEVALKDFNPVEVKDIRQDIAKILRNSKPPSCNITKEEKISLNNLKKNKDIIILKVDKGNATVITNRAEYDRKMEDHTNNSGCYKILDTEHSAKILRDVTKKIKYSSLDIIKKR